MRRLLAVVAAGLALLVLAAGPAAAAGDTGSDNVIEIGHDAVVDRPVERVVVLGGDLRLGPRARVDGDVIVLFGDVHSAPGARVGGSEYVAGRGLVSWIPGPGWVAGLLLVLALLLYRIAVWAAVCAIAAALPRSALFERWSEGWEGRPGVALAIGLAATAVALPVLALLAITTVGLPLALIGLAGLLLACGAGLALFREGPFWPRRPNRWAYAAYLLLPPALEMGLLVTAGGGLGSLIRGVTRRAQSSGGR